MPDPTPLRLLFVEDDDYLRDTMAVLLEDDGREVVTCASAEAALVQWRDGAFDVVVTDVTLGALSGIDLARRVLADDPLARVVLTSGYALDPALLALGPNVRTLPKPFEVSAFEAVLRLGTAQNV